MAHVWLKSGTIAAGDQAVMRPKDIDRRKSELLLITVE
jgi:hypothetical protein